MKKSTIKLLSYAIIPAIGLGILGLSSASAHGLFSGGFGFGGAVSSDRIADEQQNMFQNEAQLLGISVDDVKNAWSEGKSFSQLAQEKGITSSQLQEKLKNMKIEQFKSQLKALVDKGIITQEQADKRLQFIQNQITAKEKNGRSFTRGFHGLRGMMGMMY